MNRSAGVRSEKEGIEERTHAIYRRQRGPESRVLGGEHLHLGLLGRKANDTSRLDQSRSFVQEKVERTLIQSAGAVASVANVAAVTPVGKKRLQRVKAESRSGEGEDEPDRL